MARPKHCDTNIILRTTTALRDEYKQYCIDNGTTLSKEINKYMEDTLNKRAINKPTVSPTTPPIEYITVSDGLLHGVTLPITLYERFNAMTQGTINGDEVKAVLKELKQYMTKQDGKESSTDTENDNNKE
jgi:hypothetical protein